MTCALKIGLWVLALSILTAPVRAVTPAAYDTALARLESILDVQATLLQRSETPLAAPPGVQAARILGPIVSVEVPGAAPVPVRNAYLLRRLSRADLRAGRAERILAYRQAIRQIETLRRNLSRAVSSEGGTAVPPPTAAARRVLSKSEFASEPTPPPSLFDRFSAWLEKKLRALHGPRISPKTPDVHINPNFAKGLLILLLTAAFGVLVVVLVQLLRRREARLKPTLLDETEDALVEARDKDSLLTLAEQYADSGEYRRAFRLVYLATLLALDTGGILRFERSMTNWEYLEALSMGGHEDIYRAMTPLTRDFDRVWYGFVPASAEDYQRALAQYRAFTEMRVGAMAS